MSNLALAFELPRDLLEVMDVAEPEVGLRVQELVALELYREGKISGGKAAEIAGKSKREFVAILARNGLAYFQDTGAELETELAALLSPPKQRGKL